jgi:hypothetical protein
MRGSRLAAWVCWSDADAPYLSASEAEVLADAALLMALWLEGEQD